MSMGILEATSYICSIVYRLRVYMKVPWWTGLGFTKISSLKSWLFVLRWLRFAKALKVSFHEVFFQRYAWIGNELCFLMLQKFSIVITFSKTFLWQVSLTYFMHFTSVLSQLIFLSWILTWEKNFRFETNLSEILAMSRNKTIN